MKDVTEKMACKTMEGKILGEPIIRRSLRNTRQENIHTHIFTPRTHQVELLDAALQRNTIVCLGTNTGKTFIAVMLIKELAHQVRVPFKDGGKRTIFLVNTGGSVQLAVQQAAVIRLHTDLSVGEFTDEEEDHWQEQLDSHQVLVMTPQVFLHLLRNGFIPLSRINLLIFDECHLAALDHPYVEIMKCYSSCPSESVPRILGLTVSVLNNKCKTPQELEENLARLEKVLHCKAKTALDMSVHDMRSTKPEEKVEDCEEYVDKTGLIERFDQMLQPALDFVQDCNLSFDPEAGQKDPLPIVKRALQECQYVLYTLGPWCAGKVAHSVIKQLTTMEEREADATVRQFFQLTMTQLRMIERIMDHAHDHKVNCLEDFMLYMSPKVHRLVEILHKYKPEDNFVILGGDDMAAGSSDREEDEDEGDGDADVDSMSSDGDFDEDDPGGRRGDSSRDPRFHYVAVKRKQCEEDAKEDDNLCGIVFCERRHTAFVLNKLLTELCNWDVDLFFVQNHDITGHGVFCFNKGLQLDMIFKKQEEILRKFRHREINLLVSTRVLEKGVNVPKCNLVVCFDHPGDYRSYVHSKARARAAKSKYYILIEHSSIKQFQEDLKIFEGFEKILLNKYADNEDQSADEGDTTTEELPPYKPGKEEDAPKVTMGSAITLVNRYCAKLPSDAFTHLTPRCTVEAVGEDRSQYVATLQLPINSLIKYPIKGQPMSSRKLAQKAVALKACEILHRAGELDDHLLPVGKEMIKYEDEENEWEEAAAMGQARPGTTKRKQYYFKKIAEPFLGQLQADKTCYMYNIHLTLTCPVTEEQNTRGRKIYPPEDSPRGFGLLCDCWIPPVPKFPVFTRSGEVTVSVDLIAKEMTFTKEQLERMVEFHHFVFSQVLRLEKEPMKFDPKNADCSYIIVPLDNSSEEKFSIDWDFIDQIEEAPLKASKRKHVNEEESKEEFVFRSEDFENAVVMPSYRNIDQPQYFYVAEIRHDLHPRCSFPSPELYDTFEHYYNSKYGLKITSPKQPLLDVDHTSARLNLLTPRYMNQKGVALPTSSAETRKSRRENLQQKQILIPELCDVHPFPASLWRKAVCLPAILYRMNYLLIAEELRYLIAKEARIGVVNLPSDFRFPELEFGFSTKPTASSSRETTACSTRKGSAESDPSGVDAGDKKPLDIDSTLETAEKLVSSNTSELDHVKSKGPSENQTQCPEETGKNNEGPVKTDQFHAQMNGIISDIDELCLDSSPCQERDSRITELGQDPDGTAQSPPCPEHGPGVDSNMDDKERAQVLEKDQTRVLSHSEETKASTGLAINLLPHSEKVNCMEDVSNDDGDSCDRKPLHPGASSAKAAKTVSELDSSNKEDETYQDGSGNTSNPQSSDLIQDAAKNMQNAPGEKQSEYLSQVAEESDSEEEEEEEEEEDAAKEETEQIYAPFIEFDREEDLESFIGPSPCMILQTLTMSNANDFFNLERLETVGDSFLKFAITVYLYCTYPGIHEGKLSYLRSKQVSNYNLYKLGKKKGFPDCMIAAKFEPTENWLPPGYVVSREAAFKGLNVYIASKKRSGKSMIATNDSSSDSNNEKTANKSHNADSRAGENSGGCVSKEAVTDGDAASKQTDCSQNPASETSQVPLSTTRPITEQLKFDKELEECIKSEENPCDAVTDMKCLIPYNLQTQHSLPDKSIADCVEALIGCYLVACGQTAALQFMFWLGLNVLPEQNQKSQARQPNADADAFWDRENQPPGFGLSLLHAPLSPLLTHVPEAAEKISEFYKNGYGEFEERIQYTFQDKSYLLQAFTHGSYHYNNVTDCYQRLEFLGDAILDYVITRHLFEDGRKHSPGILTDLRSALVNNNIFAALAVKWDFHKYFKAISPQLFGVIDKFVAWQKENNDEINLDEEFEAQEDGKQDEGEDIEIPKALGDIFESVAGAIYLDSKMSLDTVWKVYYRMMKPQIDAFTEEIPKSPVRELLEMEPETAKFEKPERTLGGKIRVTVNVVGKGNFKGIGRNYRIAKSAAAKRALKFIRNYNIEIEKFERKQKAMHEALFGASG